MSIIKNKLYNKILYSFFYYLSLIGFTCGCNITRKLNIDSYEMGVSTSSLPSGYNEGSNEEVDPLLNLEEIDKIIHRITCQEFIDRCKEPCDDKGNNYIHRIAIYNDYNKIESFNVSLRSASIDDKTANDIISLIKIKNREGKNSFHILFEKGHTDVLKHILILLKNINKAKGIDEVKLIIGEILKIKDDNTLTPIQYAIKNGHLDIITTHLDDIGIKKGELEQMINMVDVANSLNTYNNENLEEVYENVMNETDINNHDESSFDNLIFRFQQYSKDDNLNNKDKVAIKSLIKEYDLVQWDRVAIEHLIDKHDLELVIDYLQSLEKNTEDQLIQYKKIDKKGFICDRCLRHFDDKNILTTHVEKHKSYSCEQCTYSSDNLSNVRRHMEGVHNNGQIKFKCDVCHEKFKLKDYLDKHYKCVHSEVTYKERRYICKIRKTNDENSEYCDKKFRSKYDLEQHKKRHLEHTFVKCIKCNKTFEISKENDQCTNCHPPFSKCNTCGKEFITKEELKQHKLVHTKERHFECPKCKKCFKSEKNLKQHQQMHNKEPSNECDVCHKKFKFLASLSSHKLVHRNRTKQPLKCKTCKKTFNYNRDLKIHLRTHTGEKPYKCEVCGKGCSQSGDLKKHLRIHTGEKLYGCPYCPKKFNNTSNRRRHELICPENVQRTVSRP